MMQTVEISRSNAMNMYDLYQAYTQSIYVDRNQISVARKKCCSGNDWML
jgi:hypothetical protein